MADGAVIGALRVVLGADTASLEKGLKSSQDNLSAFSDAVKTSMAAAAAAATAAAVAIGVSIKHAIDNADQMNKLSQSTGTTVEEFSKLKYAAELSDISTEQLGKAMTKLSKSMLEAATGGAGASNAFTAMKIAVKNSDGTLRDSSDVLKDIAGKFEGYRDGAAKTALATQIFSKGGAAMIPLLNQGKAGLESAGEEAARYGLVLDKKTTTAAENFNDNLKRMSKINEGIIVQLTAQMLPSFEQLSAVMLEAKGNSTLLSGVAEGFATVMKGVITAVLGATTSIQRMGAELGAFWNLVKSFPSGPEAFAKAWEAFTATEAETNRALTELGTTISNLWKDAPDFDWKKQADDFSRMAMDVGRAGGEMAKGFAPVVGAADEGRKAIDAFLAAQAKKIAGQNAEAASIGQNIGAYERLKVIQEASAIGDAKKIAATPELVKSILATADAAAQAAERLKGAQLIDQMTSPWDQRTQKVQQYMQAMIAAGATSEQLSAMQMQIQFPNFTAASNAAMDFGANLDRLATSSVSQLSSTLADVIMGTKSAAEAFTAFAKQVISQIIQMITQLLILKAIKMSLGFFFADGGPVGVGLAKGGLPGFAPGGNVHGPGSGTSDSIPAMLSAGEFVINAAAARQIGLPMLNALNNGQMPESMGDDAAVQPSSGAQRTTSVIRLVTDEISRPFVEKLIPALNDALRDGHRIQIAAA